MIFREIGNIENRIKELSNFDFNKENQNKIHSLKSDLENIIQLDLKNDFLFEKINNISFKPKAPYFIENADEVRTESWGKGVSEIQEIGSLVVSELQKTASINNQKDIREIIGKNTEDSFFELKSTLRWDVNESKINKELEQVIVKSIASFSNGKGGNVLIGVENNGNVLGLGFDYKTLKNGAGTRDEFELHLRSLLENAFGITFTTNQLDIIFPIISVDDKEEKEICHIKIVKGRKPLFIDKKDKNSGVKREVFYLRSGNSSKEIEKMSDFFEYAKHRFDNVT